MWTTRRATSKRDSLVSSHGRAVDDTRGQWVLHNQVAAALLRNTHEVPT
jgi:hypothetical protein